MKKTRSIKPIVEVTDKLPPWRPGTPKPPVESPKSMKITTGDTLEVCAVRSRALRDARYTKTRNGTGMAIEGTSVEGGGLLLTAVNWIRLSDEIRTALEQLDIRAVDDE